MKSDMQLIEKMKIHIVDTNTNTCNELRRAFDECENVSIHNENIVEFYRNHREEIDCLVSPANAFGLMTGGYDAALSNILGNGFQDKVQSYIKEHFYGEQGVATSFIIETDYPGLYLIHTPTMRYPSVIKDDKIVYYCMRSTLICALENKVSNIVIPVFGGLCGGVHPSVAARNMKDAYMQIMTRKGPEYLF